MISGSKYIHEYADPETLCCIIVFFLQICAESLYTQFKEVFTLKQDGRITNACFSTGWITAISVGCRNRPFKAKLVLKGIDVSYDYHY